MKWQLYGDFVEVAGTAEAYVFVERGATVRDALERLLEKYPALGEVVLDGDELAEGVHVVHNHRDIYQELGRLDTELEASDQLALFSPLPLSF